MYSRNFKLQNKQMNINRSLFLIKDNRNFNQYKYKFSVNQVFKLNNNNIYLVRIDLDFMSIRNITI